MYKSFDHYMYSKTSSHGYHLSSHKEVGDNSRETYKENHKSEDLGTSKYSYNT